MYTAVGGDYTKAKDYVRDDNDCEYILYVNGAWRGDDALGRLMHDFHCANPDDMYYPLMADRLRHIKETEAGKVELVGLAEEFFNEGKAQANRKAAIGFLHEGVDHSMIARVLGFTLEEVKEIAEDLNCIQGNGQSNARDRRKHVTPDSNEAEPGQDAGSTWT